MCLIFFAKDLEVNEYFNIKILNETKTRCFQRAREIKEKLGQNKNSNLQTPKYNNSQNGTNKFFANSENAHVVMNNSNLTSKYFTLNPQDLKNPEPEFNVDMNKIFEVKINKTGQKKFNKVKKKKDFGPVWYDNQKAIQIKMNMSVQKLKKARTCSYNKSPEFSYKILCELYNEITSNLK
jgi:hypothetical protein